MPVGKVSSNAICRELGEEIVIMDLASEKYFKLNSTGAVIWKLIEEGKEKHHITRRLVELFDIGEDDAESDVEELISQLQQAGLVTRQD